jgi:hypothetical protein
VRQSDRWITPGVVVAGLLCGTVALLGVAGCVTYLADRGVDPDPMLRLVAEVGGALSGLASLLLQLVNRRTTAKVERNTGVLASAVYDVADALPQPVARHAAQPATAAYGKAPPGPRGS